ncbi:hypothetical protein [Fusibacter ferrireducens]|uniref:Uncharacterized protein n=1 Tax=Fusibacter ferrireducens TaxID=2785058 RepID=A0ABR9ZN17_9FIRM|nr:hypothetical protein [Fusibacter ferrireducens]MBF4691872.1 hypothetical protein [Fusibacter ferrireducens]
MKKTLSFISIIILLLAALTWQQFHMKTLLLTNKILQEKVDLYKSQFDFLNHKFNKIDETHKKTIEDNADAYSKALQYYTVALTRLNEELEQQVEIISHDYKKESLLVFKLLDDEGLPYIDHYGILSPNLTDEDKVKYLASYLQKHYFENVSIDVKSVEIIDGKRTAIVNLTNLDSSLGDKTTQNKWENLYFQGSTGGSMTEIILIDGFLQDQLVDWPLDAVRFLYKNEPIHFEHVPQLEHIHYRN